jgi:hypothetical protein
MILTQSGHTPRRRVLSQTRDVQGKRLVIASLTSAVTMTALSSEGEVGTGVELFLTGVLELCTLTSLATLATCREGSEFLSPWPGGFLFLVGGLRL